ncbi:MAG: nucleoside 2-deoxyribosyltransferase [Oscillospiraceae bacterium]|nr:nucleoside 2-deoxyribosyltransferase [Oscillospiraceae bacterium]
MKRIYLAGFDVFRKDAVEYGRHLKALCARYGFEGLYPLDNEADSAEEIFRGNLALIEKCDILLCNLNPFRGDEPDSGTCFEVGYCFAKGKRIVGYLDDGRTMREKLGEISGGYAVEDFSMAVNLMLGCAGEIIEGGPEDALKKLCEVE